MDIDPQILEKRDQYKLMTGSIVPRLIALVTALGRGGIYAAPFSLFNMVGTSPPLLMFSVCNQGNGDEKDTIQNLRRLPECVVHICNSVMAKRMNICATDFAADVSELDMAGLLHPPHIECVRLALKKLPFKWSVVWSRS